MAIAEALTLLLSAAVVAFSAPGLFADRRRLVVLALLAAAAVALAIRPRARDMDLTPRERLARADERGNAYEAFYAAKLMADESVEGRLELARRAEAFHLFRTCEETATSVARDGDGGLGAQADAIARRCRDARAGRP